ncbi:MAG: hypothetical protein JOZ41_09020 [Chloroflexi bacterium]|nr:hypothetical protein [Chloroflexota bacterium]
METADVDDESGEACLLIEQAYLASALEGLARKLRARQQVDPVLEMEAALAAMATIRAWLRVDQLRLALEAGATTREQRERWRRHLAADVAYFGCLGELIAGEW